MKTAAVLLALGAMLTVEQRDAHRSSHDRPSSAVSADGRFVAFTRYSQLAPADEDHRATCTCSTGPGSRSRLKARTLPSTRETAATPASAATDGSSSSSAPTPSCSTTAQMDVTTILGEGRQPSITENGRVAVFAAAGFDRVADTDVNGEVQGHLFCRSRRRSGTPRQCRDAAGWTRTWRRASNRAPAATADMWHSHRGGSLPAAGGIHRWSSCAIRHFRSPG